MMTGGFAAGFAKVAVVGGLMAAAAGGVYVVASTTGDDEASDRVQIAETETPSSGDTPTPEVDTTATIDPLGDAETPTSAPEATATELPAAEATFAARRFPTPEAGYMRIRGSVWIDARAASVVVAAYVGDQECAQFESGAVPDDYDAEYSLLIPSADILPGCGEPGATIRFRLDGVEVDQTAVWVERQHIWINLMLGPPFARYLRTFKLPPGVDGLDIEPLIDGKVCGESLMMQATEVVIAIVAVHSAERTVGCGTEGAVVTFRLVSRGDDGTVTVIEELPETESWTPCIPDSRSAQSCRVPMVSNE